MRQLINVVTGFVFGLAPIAGAALIGFAFYFSFPNVIGIMILIMLGILFLLLGVKIFKRVQIVEPIEYMTATHASPDLDHLQLTENSETKKRSTEELAELIINDQNLCKGGAIRIFSDWFGKPFGNYQEIQSANFDGEVKQLILQFEDEVKLEIYNPTLIFQASTFLKVAKANRIRLTWFRYDKSQRTKNQYYLDYKREGKKIITYSNVDWYKPLFDVSLGAPALMIYG